MHSFNLHASAYKTHIELIVNVTRKLAIYALLVNNPENHEYCYYALNPPTKHIYKHKDTRKHAQLHVHVQLQ